ncbi:hypothetical protein CSV67_03410 [Sporosarcina sp. P2]|nr:hypothetical protein CSV67_03410 [Sporosarcina sp. P2]
MQNGLKGLKHYIVINIMYNEITIQQSAQTNEDYNLKNDQSLFKSCIKDCLKKPSVRLLEQLKPLKLIFTQIAFIR